MLAVFLSFKCPFGYPASWQLVELCKAKMWEYKSAGKPSVKF